MRPPCDNTTLSLCYRRSGIGTQPRCHVDFRAQSWSPGCIIQLHTDPYFYISCMCRSCLSCVLVLCAVHGQSSMGDFQLARAAISWKCPGQGTRRMYPSVNPPVHPPRTSISYQLCHKSAPQTGQNVEEIGTTFGSRRRNFSFSAYSGHYNFVFTLFVSTQSAWQFWGNSNMDAKQEKNFGPLTSKSGSRD